MPPEELIKRLEQHYAFECEGGPLRLCVEWQQLSSALSIARALVERWHDAAVWEHESGDPRQSGTWDQCADELADALDGKE